MMPHIALSASPIDSQGSFVLVGTGTGVRAVLAFVLALVLVLVSVLVLVLLLVLGVVMVMHSATPAGCHNFSPFFQSSKFMIGAVNGSDSCSKPSKPVCNSTGITTGLRTSPK